MTDPASTFLLSTLREMTPEERAEARELLDGDQHHDELDAWLNTAEAADFLGCHPVTIRKLAAAGRIPSEQDGPGYRRYFLRSELERWRRAGGPSALASAA